MTVAIILVFKHNMAKNGNIVIMVIKINIQEEIFLEY